MSGNVEFMRNREDEVRYHTGITTVSSKVCQDMKIKQVRNDWRLKLAIGGVYALVFVPILVCVWLANR